MNWFDALDLPVLDADGRPWTGAQPAVSLRRQGGAWYTPDPAQVAGLGQGWYRITPTESDRSVPGWLLATTTGVGLPAFTAGWVGPDAGPVTGAAPYYSLPFFLADRVTGLALAGVNPADITALVRGMDDPAFAPPVGAIREVGLGVYEILPDPADVAAVGPLVYQAYSAGSETFGDEFDLILPAGADTTLRQAIVARLNSIPAVTALVGTRVYFDDPSQLSVYPCLAVMVDERKYGHNLDGADGSSVASVHIEAISQYESVSVAVMEAIRDSFDGFRGVQSGVSIGRCFLDDEYDATSPPLANSDAWIYHVVVEYRIWHRVNFPTQVTQTNV